MAGAGVRPRGRAAIQAVVVDHVGRGGLPAGHIRVVLADGAGRYAGVGPDARDPAHGRTAGSIRPFSETGNSRQRADETGASPGAHDSAPPAGVAPRGQTAAVADTRTRGGGPGTGRAARKSTAAGYPPIGPTDCARSCGGVPCTRFRPTGKNGDENGQPSGQ
jgi:hypothetical protein